MARLNITFSPHFFRNFSRILVINLVIVLFVGLLLYKNSTNDRGTVHGAKVKASLGQSGETIDNPYFARLAEEMPANIAETRKQIDETIKVIEARPDYGAAWLKLAELYRRVGRPDLYQRALEQARSLNSGF